MPLKENVKQWEKIYRSNIVKLLQKTEILDKDYEFDDDEKIEYKNIADFVFFN